MPRCVAFLRAVNVGGNIIKMTDLRAVFESLGFSNVASFIASGNVIFDCRATDLRRLEALIARRLEGEFGYPTAVFVRTDADVSRIARYKPFRESDLASARALNVVFLESALTAAAQKALMTLKTPIDDFHVDGREMYWLCRRKQSESTFSNAVFERMLKMRATFRGVNTIARLAAKYCVPTRPGAAAP